MVAIENVRGTFPRAAASRHHQVTIALISIAAALLVASVAFLAHGGGPTAARFAADMVMRTSSLVFIASYLALPLARLIPTEATAALGQERRGLALGFAGMYAVFLACIAAPHYFSAVRMPLPTMFFLGFSTAVLAVFLIGAFPGAVRILGYRAARTLESLAVGYFWLAFAFSDLEFVVGPHRPDSFHGFSLCLLVIALLVRFADAFMQKWKYRSSENAV